nr:inositol monophosphatase family protein [Beutenbergia cavernae]
MTGAPTPAETADLVVLASELARAAGDVAARMRAERVDVASTKLNANDVVTRADLAAETLLRERIAAARPHDGILGEEGARAPSSSGLTWVVDPIDGTVNYLYGLPMYSVSVAVVVGPADDLREWTPIAGAVHAPGLGRTYAAGRGLGATRDGEPIAPSATEDLASALVGTGFHYDPVLRERQGALAASLVGRVRDLRRIGSAALDLCFVAEGALDAFYEERLNPWDVAAGVLVAAEAGARVQHLPLAGELLTLAAAPGLDEALAARLGDLARDLG